MGNGSFPGLERGRGVTLTPHPLLVSRPKNRVELHLYSPQGPSWPIKWVKPTHTDSSSATTYSMYSCFLCKTVPPTRHDVMLHVHCPSCCSVVSTSCATFAVVFIETTYIYTRISSGCLSELCVLHKCALL